MNSSRHWPQTCESPCTLMGKNDPIQAARNTSATKHHNSFDIRHQFLHDRLDTRRLDINNVPNTHMIAYLLAKILKPQRFAKLRQALNTVPPLPRTSISVPGTVRAKFLHADRSLGFRQSAHTNGTCKNFDLEQIPTTMASFSK